MVYDLTGFLEAHPGGRFAILQQAGKDASAKFTLLHPPNTIEALPSEYCLGPIDPGTLPAHEEQELTADEVRQQEAREQMPSAASMLLVQDFDYWAERVLSTTAWAYYRSASDEEATYFDNRDAWRRYFFRPRILRDTSRGSIATTVVGIPSSMPIFIAPAAMAKLGHPLGEVNLTKAAGRSGVIQAISANASCGLEEMFDARVEGQQLIFQLYLNKDRSASSALIEQVTMLGASAIILTVDVCWQSKRTLDVRGKLEEAKSMPATNSITTSTNGLENKSVSEQISGYQATDMTWDDIDFVRKQTHVPIIIKGVQSIEDVQLCVEHGAQGVILVSQASPATSLIQSIQTLTVRRYSQITVVAKQIMRRRPLMYFTNSASYVQIFSLGSR